MRLLSTLTPITVYPTTHPACDAASLNSNAHHNCISLAARSMDERGWLKVTDVGIADVIDIKGLCHIGSGTPGYMSPELYAKPRPHT